MKINITIPCHNEGIILHENIIKLFTFLKQDLTNDQWEIIISDNNSSDNTLEVAKKLSNDFNEIKYITTTKQGKGMAIKYGWEKHDADIYIFMDADLSTEITAIPDLIDAIKKENYDVVIGSRFHKLSSVERSLLRNFISHGYKIIKKIIIKSKISDLPCGFKAVNKKIIENVLPTIKSSGWFFDSELVILSENLGYRIKEIPVKWKDTREENDKSKVRIIPLSIKYLKNILKLKKRIK